MTRLQYVGQSHYRNISAKDLRDLGFEGAEKIELQREDMDPVADKGLSSVAEVSQDIAEFLVKREKGEWKILADGEGPSADPDPSAVKLDPSGTELVGEGLTPEGVTQPDATAGGATGSVKTPSARNPRT